MTKAGEVILRASEKEARDAMEMLQSEVGEAQTADDAHRIGQLAVSLERGFADIAQAAARKAEWLLEREQGVER